MGRYHCILRMFVFKLLFSLPQVAGYSAKPPWWQVDGLAGPGLFAVAKQVRLLLAINPEKSLHLKKGFYLELRNWATSKISDLHSSFPAIEAEDEMVVAVWSAGLHQRLARQRKGGRKGGRE